MIGNIGKNVPGRELELVAASDPSFLEGTVEVSGLGLLGCALVVLGWASAGANGPGAVTLLLLWLVTLGVLHLTLVRRARRIRFGRDGVAIGRWLGTETKALERCALRVRPARSLVSWAMMELLDAAGAPIAQFSVRGYGGPKEVEQLVLLVASALGMRDYRPSGTPPVLYELSRAPLELGVPVLDASLLASERWYPGLGRGPERRSAEGETPYRSPHQELHAGERLGHVGVRAASATGLELAYPERGPRLVFGLGAAGTALVVGLAALALADAWPTWSSLACVSGVAAIAAGAFAPIAIVIALRSYDVTTRIVLDDRAFSWPSYRPGGAEIRVGDVGAILVRCRGAGTAVLADTRSERKLLVHWGQDPERALATRLAHDLADRIGVPALLVAESAGVTADDAAP